MSVFLCFRFAASKSTFPSHCKEKQLLLLGRAFHLCVFNTRSILGFLFASQHLTSLLKVDLLSSLTHLLGLVGNDGIFAGLTLEVILSSRIWECT